jgi:hypothetical protein
MNLATLRFQKFIVKFSLSSRYFVSFGRHTIIYTPHRTVHIIIYFYETRTLHAHSQF